MSDVSGTAGPYAAPPIRLPGLGREQPWDAMREALAVRGAVVVYGRLADWTPAPGPGRTGALRQLLGRDWPRYQALTHPRVRDRFVASRLLLRHATSAALHTAPESIELAYQPGGRPYLRGCDQIEVNLSHTDDLVVVGVNRRGRVGVDIERIDRSLAGAEPRALTPYERRRLDRLTGPARAAALVRTWTLKEAYSKALGQGMRLRFHELAFDITRCHARLLLPDGAPADDQRWAFHTWTVDWYYVVSVALHLTGFGESTDIAAATALDDGLLDTLLRAPPPPSPSPPRLR